MQWMGLCELRERFLSYFEQRGHHRFNSFSLIPYDDKSLLLINSGMAPLKKYFLLQETVPNNRATSCQKCIRTPDIERVGITARHGTFFEMLGNFSFADYFKREAAGFAFDFLTKELSIPLHLLYFSVYEDDDEAYKIWTDELSIPKDHMSRFGKEDNFWEIGAGPCGPCSEIYFDRGSQYGCGKSDCKVGCDCDRYIEVWNLVFTQFISDGNGNYERMANGNIDTGMGLERLACVMQGVDNLFEVDTIKNIITHIENLSGVLYRSNEKNDISIRVIADHIRSTVFLVCDGVLPSNEGRGYVLRRLLRRAARHGQLLGIKGTFLSQLCDTVIMQSKSGYPELLENCDYIKKVVGIEEDRFEKTIDSGFSLLMDEVKKHLVADKKILSGAVAFKLSDTFGFPYDLTAELLQEYNMTADEDEFKRCLEKQRKTARNARTKQGDTGWAEEVFADKNLQKTEFAGFENLSLTTTVLAIAQEGIIVDAATADEDEYDLATVAVILDRTPFYAESGGQVGDIGRIYGIGCYLDVCDTKKLPGGLFLHNCTIKNGIIKQGDVLTAEVNQNRRYATMRNHTAAHLLQQALICRLGEHVHQAGSYVDDTRLRFDFTHFSPMSADEIADVEDIVNDKIFSDLPVLAREFPIEEAKKLGARALFGEKYGNIVRIVSAGDYSVEFCGGTHVSNTSRIGCFKILSEGSVASGIRRIEATTGFGVLSLLSEKNGVLTRCADLLKLNSQNELPQKLAAVVAQSKHKDTVIANLKSQGTDAYISQISSEKIQLRDTTLFCGLLPDVDTDTLREACLRLKNIEDTAVVFLIGKLEEKYLMASACSSGAIAKGISAGNIVKAVAAKFGGNGGGKPDFAMGGLKNETVVNDIFSALPNIIEG